MKTIYVSLFFVVLLLGITTGANGQTTYHAIANHFVETWNNKAIEWEKIRDYQYVIYMISALLSIVSGVLHTMKKGAVWLAVCLSTLVALSTQVSWLFNVQPKKYDWAVSTIKYELGNFQYSLFGQDLNNPAISAIYLDQQQKLEQKFFKIEQWLIEEQTEAPTASSSHTRIETKRAITPIFASLQYELSSPSQCLDPQFDFAKSKTIKAGNFSTDLPAKLLYQINNDKTSIYFVGFSSAPNATDASVGADECVKQAITKFIAGNDATIQLSAEQVSKGIFDLSENILLKFFEQSGQLACMKIVRTSKTSLDSYFSNVNSLKLRNPQQTNRNFKTKITKSKAVY